MKLVCNICAEPFSTLSESHKHYLERHKRAAYWKCCNIQLDTEHQLSNHMQYHDNENVFKCAACAKCFMTTKTLRYHIQSVHFMPSDLCLECAVCQKKFSDQWLLRSHEESHITMKCPHCARVITESFYERHILVAHTATAKVMCDICGKVSCDSKAHRLHYLVEHSGIDQKLQCDMCGIWLVSGVVYRTDID